MSTTSRQVILGNTIILEIDIRSALNVKVDPDSTPEVSIVDSKDNIRRIRSSTDVVRIDTGRYRLNYTVPSTADTGIWQDFWSCSVSGVPTDARLDFIVLSAGASIDASGVQIGDDPELTWTQTEIAGLNILIKCLKNRLKNDVQVESLDQYGNIEFVDCSIFTDDELTWFLKCSLSEFNETPHFTDFTFADQVIYERYGHVIVEGAFIMALAAQVLIEAGKEFTVQDNGIGLNPPPLSSAMNNEINQFLSAHRERLKFIKGCIKPYPLGFGGFRLIASNVNYMRLRHLRQRRII